MAEEVEPAVRITLKDVWQEQRDMKEQLGRLVDQLPDHIKDVNGRLDDHEARMRQLERRVWGAIGGGSLIITVATLIIGALALFIR